MSEAILFATPGYCIRVCRQPEVVGPARGYAGRLASVGARVKISRESVKNERLSDIAASVPRGGQADSATLPPVYAMQKLPLPH